ncbi:MAG: AbrB/MazE/SpoVT family DNA-binding domain-containing protein [Acidobacteria bacterium]|nr:AbrB/MazE/SpoVT family DNA-binding domain-containing protein [Acidobacteriota bacterium]
MRFDVVITKSGQITIPAAIRKRLGIKPGQKVYQSIQNGRILLEFDLPNESVERIRIPKSKEL